MAFFSTSLATLRKRHAKLTDDLTAARKAADGSIETRISAALGDDSKALDKAEASARAAQDRVATLGGALERLDADIAAAEEAEAAAQRKAKRDQAIAQVKLWLDETLKLRATLVPLVNRNRELSVIHDAACVHCGNYSLGQMIETFNPTLFAPDAAAKDFEYLISKLAVDDYDANSAAARILDYKLPVLQPVQ